MNEVYDIWNKIYLSNGDNGILVVIFILKILGCNVFLQNKKKMFMPDVEILVGAKKTVLFSNFCAPDTNGTKIFNGLLSTTNF